MLFWQKSSFQSFRYQEEMKYTLFAGLKLLPFSKGPFSKFPSRPNFVKNVNVKPLLNFIVNFQTHSNQPCIDFWPRLRIPLVSKSNCCSYGLIQLELLSESLVGTLDSQNLVVAFTNLLKGSKCCTLVEMGTAWQTSNRRRHKPVYRGLSQIQTEVSA